MTDPAPESTNTNAVTTTSALPTTTGGMFTTTTPPPASGAPKPAEPKSAKDDGKQGDPADGFKSKESKEAVLADLAKERQARQALEARLDAQNKAFAEALGVTEAPKNEDLAETVKSLQDQIAKDRHDALLDRVAAANGIDDEHKDLLTETDPERLKAQAAKVGALVSAKKAAEATPEFQANPGQGQGGATPNAEALAEAEYAKFYPPST
jgi:hypothetical protein